MILLVRFRVILILQLFSRAHIRLLISDYSGRTTFVIFARDRFQYYLFGLMIQLVRSRAKILKGVLSRAIAN